MEKYTFADYQSGKMPPKGWDCADAVADGWGKAELDAYMRETAMPVDEWRAWRAEQFPGDFEKPAARPLPAAPAGKSSQEIIQQLKPMQQEKPRQATVTDIRTGKTVAADDSWKMKLVHNKDDKPKPGVAKNWAMYLLHHEEMSGVLGYDEFAGRIVLANRPPWDKGSGAWSRREIVDVDISHIVEWLETEELAPKFSTVPR